MKTMFVRPADDVRNPERVGKKLIVRDPDRGFSPLPDEGAPVPTSQYWMGQLRDGSVVKCDPPATTDPAAAAPSAATANNRPRRASSAN